MRMIKAMAYMLKKGLHAEKSPLPLNKCNLRRHLSIQIVCKVTRLHFCCAAALPRTAAPLAQKELLCSTFFKVIILASRSNVVYSSPPKLFRNVAPLSCRHPWNRPGRFVSACMRAVFCSAPVEHVWALPLIGRLTSSTDNRMKNSSTITHGRSSPSVCQEDGIGSRYQVSEVRMASAWNIRFKPPRQGLVTLQPFPLSQHWDDC